MIASPGWRRLDRALRTRFAEGGRPERLEWLAGYFVLGFVRRRLPPGSLAQYPGAPSTNGAAADRMEGFSRIAPLLGAWISGGRPDPVTLPDGSAASPVALLAEGLSAGTDPGGPGYWGALQDRRQPLAEAADIALALWLARDQVWRELDGAARTRVLAWLRRGVDRQVVDNNWHLFPVLIWAALRALGETGLPDEAGRAHYDRFKEFHLGDGWFRDGPSGQVDYYNAWQMHYSLFWLGEMLPSFDEAFRCEAAERFTTTYRSLIGPEGFPILGRSVCYRMAAPTPLVAAALRGSPEVTPGMARRALDRTWAHFVGRGAVERGLVTQGYGRTDLRLLDSYSGPASPLWSLRSLVTALHAGRDHPFWTAPEEPLPVECDSFELRVPAIGWKIVGDEASGDIVVEPEGGDRRGAVPLRSYPMWRRALDRWRGRPERPDNYAAKFEGARYSAREPFCGYG